ncbi:MAG: hypothetical protein NT012_00335 [Candidatus Nealsonbacteria bacterium]|nr:hypothetical protein [Candidatus Nealsonbacteria bacterium]
MDCRHNTTDTDKFSIFVSTSVLPREEINRKANTYQNFLNEDGTPKSRNRHKLKRKYTLTSLQNKVLDEDLKGKFQKLRQYLKNTNPTIHEEYTKRRLVYWTGSNQCPYTIEPHRKSLWLGVNGRRSLKGYSRYFDHNKTYFKITSKTDVRKVLE